MAKRLLKMLPLGASLLPISAYAHDGDHSGAFFANILHWLSSPTHSLFAVIAAAVFVGLAFKLIRRRQQQ